MEKNFDCGQAMAEAERCLLCHDAPCSKGCPALTNPGEFIRKLRLRNVAGAIRTVKENNILGGACGALCPTARLCEKECAATGIDRPIRIGKIQRFLVEHSWKIGFKPFAGGRFELPRPVKGKVAVIGAGPAGLACAAELAKNGCQVTVFEERAEPGGVLRYGVPGFRLSAEFLKKELEDIKALGVTFRCSQGIKGPDGAEKLLKKGFQAVFIGIGLWAPVRPPFGGKEGANVIASVRFLELYRGKPAQLRKLCGGKPVAVIGGGSVAVDCARTALRLGAEDVYLVYRRSFAQMPAEELERIEALNEGIHFLPLNQPTGYARDARGNLTGVKLVRTRLSGKDSSGRRKPSDVKGSDWVLDAGACIEAIGNKPEERSLSLGRLISADPGTGRTSKAGIFAGGDIVRGPATVVQAVADGKAAARAIMKQLAK
ncbi:MAG: FAD-dependent oxidoreductase [Elusimicrobiota bacterium]|nr:FAD-dependent oxidoreductase [Elusimicrobiota bacterium]